MQETKHGGAREGAGRKPKADELRLAERMDAIMESDDLLRILAEKIRDKDINAIKIWVSYRFGMPKQSVEHSGNVSALPPQITFVDADE